MQLNPSLATLYTIQIQMTSQQKQAIVSEPLFTIQTQRLSIAFVCPSTHTHHWLWLANRRYHVNAPGFHIISKTMITLRSSYATHRVNTLGTTVNGPALQFTCICKEPMCIIKQHITNESSSGVFKSCSREIVGFYSSACSSNWSVTIGEPSLTDNSCCLQWTAKAEWRDSMQGWLSDHARQRGHLKKNLKAA